MLIFWLTSFEQIKIFYMNVTVKNLLSVFIYLILDVVISNKSFNVTTGVACWVVSGHNALTSK